MYLSTYPSGYKLKNTKKKMFFLKDDRTTLSYPSEEYFVKTGPT